MKDAWQAVSLTLELAGITTVILLLIGTPLAWWLAGAPPRLRRWGTALVTLPLVLPPTVLGFYLLLLMGPEGWLGQFAATVGMGRLAFTFEALVVGSVIYSLPFMVQPLQAAFSSIGPRPLEAAASLGAGPLDRFFSIALPLARSGILTAIVLTFAHTLGEFGVVLMVGGNIPGETRVLSIAIYDLVEGLQYSRAHLLAGALLLFSFVSLLLVNQSGKPALSGQGRL